MNSAQILVVEDESIVAKGIQHDLENMGYDVPVLASSGEEALNKAAETYPDLVLMDIVLKGNMDGIETTRKLRDQFDIPVVFLTAYEDDATLQRAKITEPFGYLLKPYEERELHTTIEMALYKHRVERKLKQTEQWLTATLKSIGDAVIATDARQCIKLINSRAETMTGWSRGEASGKALPDIFNFLDMPTYSVIEEASRKAFKSSQVVELPCPCTLVARDGRQTPVEGTVAAILDDEGYFAGFVWVLRDVTEKRRAEEERRRSEEHLRQAQKMEAVTRLAGGVAHDFSNLLTVILGNNSLVLSRLQPTDPNYDALRAVDTAAVRAGELIKELLAFSGRAHLWLEPIQMNDAVQRVVGALHGLVDSRIRIEAQLAPDLWTVQADPAQIDEVLMNLGLNARDAMPGGGEMLWETTNVTVPAEGSSPHPNARPGEYVCLSVVDTGQGIAPEVLPHIFEPFVTTKEPGKGVGLGLALVFGIIEQHRGWIQCESVVNQGTRFDLYLPARRPPAPVDHHPHEAQASRNGTRTVLLVDDEPMIRELGKMILHSDGYRVLLAEDGVQAVDIYQRLKDRIDLVILDLTMPRMSGCDAFQQLVQIDPQVRVLFASGYFAEDMTTFDNRILGFITKPYRHEDLSAMVRAALAQKVEGK